MSRRHFSNWLDAYLEYTDNTEAHPKMRLWAGVATIAGALRRQVWLDFEKYKWYPNFYIILVAPPGVVSKSTTIDHGVKLLEEVPGIKFGPDVVTWQQLVVKFAESHTTYEYPPGVHNIMSAMTMVGSEFGNLFNPLDREMVDLYITLWDGKQGAFTKETKTSGKDLVENPWINMIACTTPDWIAGNFSETLIGGGFTSRCVFLYADKKYKRIAYPNRVEGRELREQMKPALVEDLTQIASIVGEYKMTEEAYAWGEEWYNRHQDKMEAETDPRIKNYFARKQTHIHKLALVIAAANQDARVIEVEHLAAAYNLVTELEDDMTKVWTKVGRSDTSLHAERLFAWIRSKGRVEWEEAFRYAHKNFPGLREFTNIINGLIMSKLVRLEQGEGGRHYLVATLSPP